MSGRSDPPPMGPSEAEIEAAAKAFHADFIAGRNVAILYGGSDSGVDRPRLKNAIAAALVAARATQPSRCERCGDEILDPDRIRREYPHAPSGWCGNCCVEAGERARATVPAQREGVSPPSPSGKIWTNDEVDAAARVLCTHETTTGEPCLLHRQTAVWALEAAARARVSVPAPHAERIDILEGQNMRLRASVSHFKRSGVVATLRDLCDQIDKQSSFEGAENLLSVAINNKAIAARRALAEFERVGVPEAAEERERHV